MTVFDICGMIKLMNEQYNLCITDLKTLKESGDLKIADMPEYKNSVHTLLAILVDSPTYNEDGTVNSKALLLERGTSEEDGSFTAKGMYRDIQLNPDTRQYKILPKKNLRKK